MFGRILTTMPAASSEQMEQLSYPIMTGTCSEKSTLNYVNPDVFFWVWLQSFFCLHLAQGLVTRQPIM